MAKPTTDRPSQPRLALLLVACGLALVAGCRAVDNAQVDVMERELRQQQQYIYELEDYLMQYSEKLRECRTCPSPAVVETKSLRKPTKAGEPTLADDTPEPLPPQRRAPASPAADTAPDVFDEPPAAPVEEPAPAVAPESVVPEQLEAPDLEIGPTGSVDHGAAAPIAATPAGDEAPPYIPDPATYLADADAYADSAAEGDFATTVDGAVEPLVPTEVSEPDAAAVVSEPVAPGPTLPPPADPARLVAQQLHIRGVYRNVDPAAGEAPSSLMVIVEALNATNEPVDANGEASLMVARGETPATLKPIERWDFTADETQSAWQSSQLGDGLHLELPLDETTLPDEPIFLWARLVTPDGKNLRARVQFSAGELTTIDAALAAAEEADNPAADGESSLAAAAPLASAEQPLEKPVTPTTQWRTASQPIEAAGAVGFASTDGGPATGWTQQPPGGRLPAAPTARVADASRPEAPPRWQQGSAEPPTNEAANSWAPARD